MAPGLSRMETPAMLCEMGNSATVASFADPPGPTQCVWLSMSYLKLGNSASFSSSAGAAVAAALVAIPARAKLSSIPLRLIGIDLSSSPGVYPEFRNDSLHYSRRHPRRHPRHRSNYPSLHTPHARDRTRRRRIRPRFRTPLAEARIVAT